LAVEGATTARVFETYVEKVLVPTLRAGQVVVMDNLGAHKPKRVKELIEGQGCELLYLPAYSPDYNPIEEAFSKIKRFLRKSWGQEQGGFGRSAGRGVICGRSRRGPGLLRACRIPSGGSTAVRCAVISKSFLRDLRQLLYRIGEVPRSLVSRKQPRMWGTSDGYAH
jgi:hypothetical protein